MWLPKISRVTFTRTVLQPRISMVFQLCADNVPSGINTLRPRQNGRHFADGIFRLNWGKWEITKKKILKYIIQIHQIYRSNKNIQFHLWSNINTYRLYVSNSNTKITYLTQPCREGRAELFDKFRAYVRFSPQLCLTLVLNSTCHRSWYIGTTEMYCCALHNSTYLYMLSNYDAINNVKKDSHLVPKR